MPRIHNPNTANNTNEPTRLIRGIRLRNSPYSHWSGSGGYALMLSIVVSSVVLSIGLSLLNIVQKELILSATGRDSQFAFYAADAGLECVLYWDLREQAFPSSEADWNAGTPPVSLGDDCGKTDFGDQDESRWNDNADNPTPLDTRGTAYTCTTEGDPPVTTCTGHENDIVTLTFQVDFSSEDAPHGSCAKIVVTKTGNGQTGENYEVQTKADSKGYNDACESDGTFDNPALVERGISVQY